MAENAPIEILDRSRLGTAPRFALFDFDGTLSLIREGWQQIMLPMFVEELEATGTSETLEELDDLVRRFVMELTGKQTIFQMMRLGEEVERRGGTAREPLEYKREYHERLMRRIADRRDQLRDGRARPDQWVVPGTFEFLDRLRSSGVELFLASGTDLNYVREEAELLQLTPYFEDRIYGALDDFRKFSKQQVIAALLRDRGLEGRELVGFGDGYVEIQNVRDVGGLAVAVASDESGRSGQCDQWKRSRLLEVGADVVVADFARAAELFELIWSH